MKQGSFEIISNIALTQNVYRMELQGDVSAITAPGQFVNIRLDGLYLRRPISVCDLGEDRLTIVYKTVGQGTERLAAMQSGNLDILTGLGNGYDLTLAGDRPVLLGGGVGVPPMYLLAKRLIGAGKQVRVLLGFNTKAEMFFEEEFRTLGADVTVTTADGSYGTPGFVTEPLKRMDYTYFYACGPESMLKAIYAVSKTQGQMSFERRMGCGFGACMGCSCKTVAGSKRICREGPVMKKEEILWES